MGVIGFAGLAKAFDLDHFAADLRTWTVLTPSARAAAMIFIPAAEIALAGFWFAGIRPDRARLLALALLLLLSAAYIFEIFTGGVPKCGCFGQLMEWYAFKDAAPWVLGKNLVLGLWLASAAEVPWSVRAAKGQRRRRPSLASPRGARAFSLIELVLSIALIGILISLLIPSLASARQSAKTVGRLADLRTHAAMTAAYAADFNDAFPCIGDPSATHTVLSTPTGPYILAYFDVRFLWWMGVYDPYYSAQFDSPSFFAPRRHGPGRGEPYWYALGCVARPEFWNTSTRKYLGQTGVVRTSEVLFPSKKGLFINWHSAFAGTPDYSGQTLDSKPIETSLGDGSAKVIASGKFIPPVPNGEGPVTAPYTSLSVGIPVVHTVDGVRGRDIE